MLREVPLWKCSQLSTITGCDTLNKTGTVYVLLLYLQAPIQSSLYGYTLARMSSVGGDCCDEGIKLVLFLLQLLDKTLDGSLGEAFALSSLPVAHQAVHNAQTGIVTCGSVRD